MATTATELRRELLTDIRDTNDDIDALLAITMKEIRAAARKHGKNKKRFKKEIMIAIATFWASYRLLTKSSNAFVATSFVEYVNATTAVKLEKAGAVKTLKQLTDQTSKYAARVEARVLSRISPYDGRSINQRIVTIMRGNEQVVEKLLQQGIDDGLSVNQVARSIQNYIDPASQAGRRFTKGNGVDYRAVKISSKLPKNSIRYNAVRIARSEIMTTYDIASRDYYEDKPWSTGWNWVLSNRHGAVDDCDALAAASPHKRLPDRPHPQCTCDPQPVVASLKEFERLVRRGVIV